MLFLGLASAHATDCNRNGISDNEEIANGTTPDCNGNGVPDECDILRQRNVRFPLLPGQIEPGEPFTLEWEALPSASSLRLILEGDFLNHDFFVGINGVELGRASHGTPACRERGYSFWIDRNTFNQTLVDGRAYVELLSLESVDPICPDAPSRVRLVYEEWNGSGDCDRDGVPDECQFGDGALTDWNGNGAADQCEPDCDESGVADSIELADGTLQDCNNNGLPDVCDVG